ncbi:MAG: hypothetical protein P8H96_07810 [Akkermansiaceae bacterium]|nr:hypothetical protein [Akkermansiaceae bacterium]
MSLHAQLSPEAQARLAAQRRTSTITSLIIAILMITLIGVILLIIAMKFNKDEIPELISYSAENIEEEELDVRKVQTQTQRKPSAPSSSMAKVIAANSASPTAIPVPEIDVPDPSLNFGDGDGFGDGWGDGSDSGAGGGFGNIPASMKKRCSRADRLSRLNSSGGTEKCEDAVVNGLRFLKKTQNDDGSWETGDYHVGFTGLALLAFLGHCETTMSEEFGETVFSAITYLVNKAMKNKGKIAADFKKNHWCYDHAIAVYALAEAYTLCQKSFGENIPDLPEAVQASAQFLINSQNRDGGWAYKYAEEGGHTDLSIVGWHMQALKAADHTGLELKNLTRSVRDGLEFSAGLRTPEGAFGYSGPTMRHDGTALAAVGALSFQIWGKSSSQEARGACKFIDDNMKFEWNTPDSDLYGHYYAAQCMMNFGGDSWKRHNEKFRDQVLNNQLPDGSFKPTGYRSHGLANGHYRACLSILMLEVYYRFLPATGAKTK